VTLALEFISLSEVVGLDHELRLLVSLALELLQELAVQLDNVWVLFFPLEPLVPDQRFFP